MTGTKEGITPSSHSQKRDQKSISYQKGGRPKKPEEHKLTVQLGARVSMQTFGWLLAIAEYEGEGYTEIVRSFVRDGISRYRQDRFFQEFMQKRNEKQ